MSLDDLAEKGYNPINEKKYTAIFIKHEDNPVLKRIVNTDSTFKKELLNFYDIGIKLEESRYGTIEMKSIKKQDDNKKGTSHNDLVMALNEFCKKDILKEDFRYESIRTKFKKYEDESSRAIVIESSSLVAGVFGAFIGIPSWIGYALNVLLVNGDPARLGPLLTYAIPSSLLSITGFFIGFRANKSFPERPLFCDLTDAAKKADQYIGHYKSYQMLKQFETKKEISEK